MRRFIATLAFAAAAVSFTSSANAGFFHKHNACCEPAPVACCEPAPVVCCDVDPCDPCAKPARKHHLRNLHAKLHAKLHARKNVCCEPVVECCEPAPAPCCEAPAPAPCCDAAPATCCDVDPCAKPARKHHFRNLHAKLHAKLHARKNVCCEPVVECCEPAPAPSCCN